MKAHIVSALLTILNSPRLFGALLPWLIAVVQRPTMKRWERMLVMLVICFVAAVVVTTSQGSFTPENLFDTLVVITVTAVVLYVRVYKYIGIDKWEDFTTNLMSFARSADKNAQILDAQAEKDKANVVNPK